MRLGRPCGLRWRCLCLVFLSYLVINYLMGAASIRSNQGNESTTAKLPARVGNQSNKSCKYCVNHRKYDVMLQPTIASHHFDLVLLITSSHRPGVKERRQAIRQSWGNDSFYTARKVSHVFLLGECYLDKILTFCLHIFTQVSLRIDASYPPRSG